VKALTSLSALLELFRLLSIRPRQLHQLEKSLYLNRLIYVTETNAIGNHTDCQCPPTCQTINYDITFSISQISDISVVDAASLAQYSHAVETRGRIDISVMSSILKALVQLLSVERTMKAALSLTMVNRLTAVPGQVLDSITVIVQATTTNISALYYDVLPVLAADGRLNSTSTFINMKAWLKTQLILNDSLPSASVDVTDECRASMYTCNCAAN